MKNRANLLFKRSDSEKMALKKFYETINPFFCQNLLINVVFLLLGRFQLVSFFVANLKLLRRLLVLSLSSLNRRDELSILAVQIETPCALFSAMSL